MRHAFHKIHTILLPAALLSAVATFGAERAVLDINFNNTKKISDMLFGVFFEDINYAADGGLYAELVRNRDFEFSSEIGDSKQWDAKTAWSLTGGDISGTTFEIAEDNPISKNNRHYAILKTTTVGASLANEGFRGIPLKKGAKYNFTVFARNRAQGTLSFNVRLTDGAGKSLAMVRMAIDSAQWKTLGATLTPTADCESAQLEIEPLSRGELCLDMVSLFPQDTFKGRKNGLRKDLAQAIADLKPKFIRFPGGCVAHGDLPMVDGLPHSGLVENPGVNDVYYWKDSVGKLEDRLPIHNRWGYHQTRGLGYYEYMLFCEDIGAEPLPILPCGVDCQFSGGQKAVPMDEMPLEVQNVLDLVEFANGSVSTKWGKVRAQMGHSKPFKLKYIGLGNEEAITKDFETRFKMIADALKKRHPEITIVGTVGPGEGGRDFENGWKFARTEKIPIVDEHFYQPPEWFVQKAVHRYDKYDRNGPKVYAGEYAAHESGQAGPRRNTMETALSEAMFLTGLERNGDVVVMSSYAPLFSKENDTQWYPDMIVFNNTEFIPTTTYEVQKMFSANAGTQYIGNTVTFPDKKKNEATLEDKIAVSVVRDKAGDVIIKLVNVSDEDVDFRVNLNRITGTFLSSAPRSTISGTWRYKDFEIKNDTVKIGKSFSCRLDSKTMSVIRIKSGVKQTTTTTAATKASPTI